jgi:hypothetical protein
MCNVPKRIYLQVVDTDTQEPMYWGDWTHCADRIHNSDIVYYQVTDEMQRSLAIVLRSVLEHTDQDSALGQEAEKCEKWLTDLPPAEVWTQEEIDDIERRAEKMAELFESETDSAETN